MEIATLLRTLGALGVVLGLLGGALWAVRRFGLTLPGLAGRAGHHRARIELIERVALDAKRSVVLFRRDDREHLFVLSPDGATVLEAGIEPDGFHAVLRRGR